MSLIEKVDSTEMEDAIDNIVNDLKVSYSEVIWIILVSYRMKF